MRSSASSIETTADSGKTTTAVRMAVTTAGSRRMISQVLAGPNTLCTKQIVQIMTAVRSGVNPVLNCLEHRAVRFITHISGSWMVEDLQTVMGDLIHRDIDVLPCIQNTGYDVSQDSSSNLTGWLVKHVGKVILGQHGVGGIRAMRIVPHFVLMLS